MHGCDDPIETCLKHNKTLTRQNGYAGIALPVQNHYEGGDPWLSGFPRGAICLEAFDSTDACKSGSWLYSSDL